MAQPCEGQRLLARLAAAVAAGDEQEVGEAARDLGPLVPRRAAEEAVLQTYLFAGFPAAINGFAALERAWPRRTDVGESVPGGSAAQDESLPGGAAAKGVADAVSPSRTTELADGWNAWRERGEVLCARVYGPWYPRLRRRMRELSPELDEWMVVEGYGKTLSRPGLTNAERELCAVAALAAVGAAPQLEAHLEGARRMGLADELVTAVAREAIARHAPPEARPRLETALAARAYGRQPGEAP